MVTIDQVLVDKLDNWYIDEWPIGNCVLCIIALLLTVLLCSIIGIERERRGTAGLRTHLLVGVGSCVIMIISIYGFPKMFNDAMNRDVARLAAQVVTGVGFLGAGAIIHRTSGTRGLTTAGTIWISMAIGLACGSMNFFLAIVAAVLIFIVMTVFRKIEARVTKPAPVIIIHAKKELPIISKVVEIAKKYNALVDEVFSEVDKNDNVEITLMAKAESHDFNVNDMVSDIEKIDGIVNVTAILHPRK